MEVKISVKPESLRTKNTIHVKIENEGDDVEKELGNQCAPNIDNIIYSPSLRGDKRKQSSGQLKAKVSFSPSGKSNVGENKNTAEITKHLLEMGYDLEGINKAYVLYKFKNIEQALFIMGEDGETGIFNHQFVPIILDDEYIYDDELIRNNGKACIICGDIRAKHPPDLELPVANNATTILDQSNNRFLGENMQDNMQSLLNSPHIGAAQMKRLSAEFLESLEKEFRGKINLCNICYAEEINDNNSITLPCKHIFCKSCVKSHLINLINEAKVTSIKCLQAGCTSSIPDKVMQQVLESSIFSKYLRFKKRINYYVNVNNGMIPCVAPDCEEWIPYKDGTSEFVSCTLGHRFCAKCKKDWHRKGRCDNVI
jgi:hypothetical protein